MDRGVKSPLVLNDQTDTVHMVGSVDVLTRMY